MADSGKGPSQGSQRPPSQPGAKPGEGPGAKPEQPIAGPGNKPTPPGQSGSTPPGQGQGGKPPEGEQLPAETLAQKVIREKKLNEWQQANPGRTPPEDLTKPARSEGIDLEGKERDKRQESSDRQAVGYGQREGGTPEDKVRVPPIPQGDGSVSPHDVSSDFNNRQQAAYKQLQDAGGPMPNPLEESQEAPISRKVTPSEEQAESGRVAKQEGRAD